MVHARFCTANYLSKPAECFSHRGRQCLRKIISVKQTVFYFSKDESMLPEVLEKISHINSTISNKIYGKAKSTK